MGRLLNGKESEAAATIARKQLEETGKVVIYEPCTKSNCPDCTQHRRVHVSRDNPHASCLIKKYKSWLPVPKLDEALEVLGMERHSGDRDDWLNADWRDVVTLNGFVAFEGTSQEIREQLRFYW